MSDKDGKLSKLYQMPRAMLGPSERPSMPGHIGTNIAHNARETGNIAGQPFTDEQHELIANYFRDHGMRPSRAASIILDGLEKRKRRIVVGKDAVRGDRLSRLFPLREHIQERC